MPEIDLVVTNTGNDNAKNDLATIQLKQAKQIAELTKQVENLNTLVEGLQSSEKKRAEEKAAKAAKKAQKRENCALIHVLRMKECNAPFELKSTQLDVKKGVKEPDEKEKVKTKTGYRRPGT